MIVKATNTIYTQLMCISINQSNRVKTPIFVICNTAMLSNYEKKTLPTAHPTVAKSAEYIPIN